MRKRNLILALGLCVILGITGCGKEKDPTGNETPTGTEAPTTGGENVTPEPTGEGIDINSILHFKGSVEISNYKGVEATKTKSVVTDAEIETQINNLLTGKSTTEEIKDRTDVQDGDVANIDYEGKIDGTAFENGADTGFDLEIGSGRFIDGFEEQLIGKKVGETSDIKVTFPDPYDKNPDMAGKEAVFTVKINSISKIMIPELTDEFIKGNSDYETIAAYKEGTKASILEQKETTANNNAEVSIWQSIIDNSKFTGVDQGEIDAVETAKRQEFESYAAAYSVDLGTFLAYFMGMTEDMFNKEIKTAAEFNVKQRIILDKIVELEKISFTEDEYKEAVEKFTKEYEYESTEEFETMVGKDKIENQILLDKAAALVMDSAVITEA